MLAAVNQLLQVDAETAVVADPGLGPLLELDLPLVVADLGHQVLVVPLVGLQELLQVDLLEVHLAVAQTPLNELLVPGRQAVQVLLLDLLHVPLKLVSPVGGCLQVPV